MKTTKIIFWLLIVVFLGVFIAYKMYNKPHVNVANEKVDVSLTANTILDHFSSDEMAANIKYLDKIIEVKGIVFKVETENGIEIITLQTNDDFGTVTCHLSLDESKKMKQVKIGQEIILKGICTGFLMDVILVKCIIINQK